MACNMTIRFTHPDESRLNDIERARLRRANRLLAGFVSELKSKGLPGLLRLLAVPDRLRVIHQLWCAGTINDREQAALMDEWG